MKSVYIMRYSCLASVIYVSLLHVYHYHVQFTARVFVCRKRRQKALEDHINPYQKVTVGIVIICQNWEILIKNILFGTKFELMNVLLISVVTHF
jgi:hypothetical protein